MNDGTFEAGYFGKLPLRGDFIQRNVDPEFIQVWDGWLQNVITNSKEILGDQWLNYYLVSPIWRFYLPLDNDATYCGLMLPSVDKVGRYFPFAIISQVDNSIPAQTLIENNKNWFNDVEQLAMNALDESINYDQLNLAIDSLNQTLCSVSKTAEAEPIHNFRIPLNDGMNINQGFAQLNQMLPHAVSKRYSYWWTAGNDHIQGNLFCCDKMPDDNVYVAMLDGQWQLCHMQTLDSANNSIQNEFI